MPILLVIIAALLIVGGFLLEQPGAFALGGLVFLIGALWHMRNRRVEMLDAMRGKDREK